MDDIEKYAFERQTECRLSKRSESSVGSLSFRLHRVQEENSFSEKSEEIRENMPDENFNLLRDFVKDPLNYDNGFLRNEFQALAKDICYYQEKVSGESENFDMSFVEYVHFLYKLDKVQDLPEILRSKLEKMKEDQERSDLEIFEVYELIEKLLILLSRLLVKFGIFDIHNYRYRYKGRSLTINFFKMIEINRYALSLDIIWMSFAINHLPFKSYVGNLILNYSKILKNVLKKIFYFIYSSSQVEGEDFLDFSQANFEIVPIYLRLFKPKIHPSIQKLYNLLSELEKSYRCFERAILEESLKMV
jgi:hypothetical protein